jgi:BlaR1 peptidase M56
MLCILYVTAVGLLLGIIGDHIERLLPATLPRRWVWCAVMAASFALPGYYRYHHAFAIGGASGAPTYAGLDAGFFSQVSAFDATIERVWHVTTVLLALWALVNAGWVTHLVRASRIGRPRPEPSVPGDIPIVVTDSLGPATVGVWRSRVVLPRWVLALPDTQRQYIVHHEDEHRRSHDCTLLFLASLLVILAPWDIALWWQLRRLSLAVEMDCDRRVVATLGDPQAYGNLLVAVAQASGRGRRLQPALLGATGMLEQRLTVLLAPAPLRLVQRLVLPVIACVLLVVVLTTPHPILGHVHPHAAQTATAAMSR